MARSSWSRASRPPRARPRSSWYAQDAAVVRGAWRVVADQTAAGGSRLHHPDAGAAKLVTALANPTNFFDITFTADAITLYRSVDPRKGGWQLVSRTIPSTSSSRIPSTPTTQRSTASARPRPPSTCSKTAAAAARRMGLAGQRLRRRRARTTHLLRGDRYTHGPCADARGRPVDRPDRPLS